MKVRVLFLCTELAGYFNACISYLQKHTDSVVRVYHWPKATSAPFQHELPGIELIEKIPNGYNNLLPAIIEFNPTIIYVGGWVDKDYLSVAKHFKLEGIPVVCGLDNPWKASLRQKASVLLSNSFIKPFFTHMWVAGSRQYQFARQLGFSHQSILHDLYTADISLFTAAKKDVYAKYLVYAGRFEKEKGVDILYEVFNRLTVQERNGWKLRMIGNGRLRKTIKGNEVVTVEDFMQPDMLFSYNRDAGGFILPSI
ncbi:MAG: glycosyltransferase, partial [Saprospiraceae bacterium]